MLDRSDREEVPVPALRSVIAAGPSSAKKRVLLCPGLRETSPVRSIQPTGRRAVVCSGRADRAALRSAFSVAFDFTFRPSLKMRAPASTSLTGVMPVSSSSATLQPKEFAPTSNPIRYFTLRSRRYRYGFGKRLWFVHVGARYCITQGWVGLC